MIKIILCITLCFSSALYYGYNGMHIPNHIIIHSSLTPVERICVRCKTAYEAAFLANPGSGQESQTMYYHAMCEKCLNDKLGNKDISIFQVECDVCLKRIGYKRMVEYIKQAAFNEITLGILANDMPKFGGNVKPASYSTNTSKGRADSVKYKTSLHNYSISGLLAARVLSMMTVNNDIFTFLYSLSIDRNNELNSLRNFLQKYRTTIGGGTVALMETSLLQIAKRLEKTDSIEKEKRNRGFMRVSHTEHHSLYNARFEVPNLYVRSLAFAYSPYNENDLLEYLSYFESTSPYYATTFATRSAFFNAKIFMLLDEPLAGAEEMIKYLLPYLTGGIQPTNSFVKTYIDEYVDGLPGIRERCELALEYLAYLKFHSGSKYYSDLTLKYLKDVDFTGSVMLSFASRVIDHYSGIPAGDGDAALIGREPVRNDGAIAPTGRELGESSGQSGSANISGRPNNITTRNYLQMQARQEVEMGKKRLGICANLRNILVKIGEYSSYVKFGFQDFIEIHKLIKENPSLSVVLMSIRGKVINAMHTFDKAGFKKSILRKIVNTNSITEFKSLSGAFYVFCYLASEVDCFTLFEEIHAICKNDQDKKAFFFPELVRDGIISVHRINAFISTHSVTPRDTEMCMGYLNAVMLYLVRYFINVKHGQESDVKQDGAVNAMLASFHGAFMSLMNAFRKSLIGPEDADPTGLLLYGFACCYNDHLSACYSNFNIYLIGLPDLTLDSCVLLFNQLCSNAVATAVLDYSRDLIEVIASVFEYFMTREFTIPFRSRLLDFMIQCLITVYKDPEYVFKFYLKHNGHYFNFMIKPTFDYYLELERQAMATNNEIRIIDYDMHLCASDILHYYSSQTSSSPVSRTFNSISWYIKCIIRNLINHGYNGAAHETEFAMGIYPVLLRMLERGAECHGIKGACPEVRLSVFVELLKGAVDTTSLNYAASTASLDYAGENQA